MKRTQRAKMPDPVETYIPPGVAVAIGLEPNARRYQIGACSVIVGFTPQTGWHLSISHPVRYPTWDEIAHARYKLCSPEITMAMLLPPAGEYVNLHPNCFHLHQIDPR